MKAIEILEWICRESIEGELLNIVDVPEEGESSWEQNEFWWTQMFGACPPHPVSAGKYLYFYESNMSRCDVYDSRGSYYEPDAMIESGSDYIHLYKLDDEEESFDAVEYNKQTLKEWMEG